jgi:DNA polymerase III alpha subunit
MGFYHPFTLVKDAQRHGVRFRPVDVTRSHWNGVLEEGEVRLGLRTVRGLRAEAGERIEAARALRPFVSLQDFEDFASAFRGIGEAQAERLWDGGSMHGYWQCQPHVRFAAVVKSLSESCDERSSRTATITAPCESSQYPVASRAIC